MNRWVKRSALGVHGIVLAAGAALFVAAQLGDRKQHRRIAIDVPAVTPATSDTSVERGRYLFMSRGCSECHGVNGAGKDVVKDDNGLLIHAPAITSTGQRGRGVRRATGPAPFATASSRTASR
jgi:mono/diheme cytochrome c family protein